LRLVCERPVGAKTATKFYSRNFPPEVTLARLVRLAH